MSFMELTKRESTGFSWQGKIKLSRKDLPNSGMKFDSERIRKHQYPQ